MLVRVRGGRCQVHIHVALIHERRSGIDERQVRREGIGAIVLPELHRLIVIDLVQGFEPEVTVREGLSPIVTSMVPSLIPSAYRITSHATTSRMVSPVRLTASAAILPETESRQTKASIFFARARASNLLGAVECSAGVTLDVNHINNVIPRPD